VSWKNRFSLPEIPIHSPAFPEVPFARGYVDGSRVVDGSWWLTGWMVSPEQPMDSVDVHLEGQKVLTTPLRDRPAVRDFLPWIEHAGCSGFELALPNGSETTGRTRRVELLGTHGGKPVGKLVQLLRADLDDAPAPPEEQMWRVVHTRRDILFKLGGLKVFGDFLTVICRHRDFRTVRRVLDWGAGVGRVAMHLLAIDAGPEVRGCDIDPHAVAWANEHVEPGAFSRIDPLPPTPYESRSFDLIVSYSVLTHLTREAQAKWLAEMQRLLAPQGLLVATVHGEFATSFALQGKMELMPADGFWDATLDPTLDGIAPDGYYRSTYQARSYTEREFSKWFDVVDYVERGAESFQDVVVMRARD